MEWDAGLAERVPLLVERVGCLRGELRLFFRPVGQPRRRYVLQLEEVASFSDSLPRGAEVRISDRNGQGSFGWWLPADDPHRSVEVAAVGSVPGVFLALARRVVYRVAAEADANNWPG